MSCDCYQIGGPWIGADPSCEAHGTEAVRERNAIEDELSAWRNRFPMYEYRPQDDGIFLK